VKIKAFAGSKLYAAGRRFPGFYLFDPVTNTQNHRIKRQVQLAAPEKILWYGSAPMITAAETVSYSRAKFRLGRCWVLCNQF
jgi:hypothetical protein